MGHLIDSKAPKPPEVTTELTMLERPCEMAGLRIVEEEVGADAINLTTEGVKGISNAGTLRGRIC